MDEKEQKLLQQLRERMKDVEVLSDEPDFFNDTDTLVRYLVAREWDLDETEKMLKATVEWRRTTKPLTVDCHYCHDRPGYHAIRQVGFDNTGRPVIYACFTQTTAQATADDTIIHAIHLVENAIRSMRDETSTWVFLLDCRGMTLASCNPRLGYSVTQILANQYPERLGLVICINHNPIFQGVWNAIKVFLQPKTVAKMQLHRKKRQYKEVFASLFSKELCDWLLAEIKLNKKKPLDITQREFWKKPADSSAHDARASPSYVAEYIDTFLDNEKSDPVGVHRVHPNIADTLHGTIKPLVLDNKKSSSSSSSKVPNGKPEENLDENALEIPPEYQITPEVIQQQAVTT